MDAQRLDYELDNNTRVLLSRFSTNGLYLRQPVFPSCALAGKYSSLCPSFLLAFIGESSFGHSLYTTIASFGLSL